MKAIIRMRVGVLLEATEKTVQFLGYGIYAGEEITPDWFGVPNPKTILDVFMLLQKRPAFQSRPISLLENEPAAASAATSTAAPTTAPAAFAACLVIASVFAPVNASVFASINASIFAAITQITEATHIRSTFRSVLPKDIGYYSICGY